MQKIYGIEIPEGIEISGYEDLFKWRKPEKEYAGKKSKEKGDKEPGKKADRSHNYKDPEKGKDAVVR